MDVINIHREASWAEIAIDRPERRNAIIPPVSHAIREALIELQADDSVQSILIRGEGGFFCSGIDLKALQADPPPQWAGDTEHWRDLHIALFNCTKPVVGAVERYAINAGAALALACDITIFGESAFLQVGEIQQGTMAPMNAAWLRLKSSEQVMARLVLYGDRVPASGLLAMGLATESVADDQVVSRAREICERIGGFPPGAGSTIKSMIIQNRDVTDPQEIFQRGGGRSLRDAQMIRD